MKAGISPLWSLLVGPAYLMLFWLITGCSSDIGLGSLVSWLAYTIGGSYLILAVVFWRLT